MQRWRLALRFLDVDSMMNAYKTNRYSMIASAFLLAGLMVFSTGCDDLSGAVMETTIKSGSADSPKRNSFAKRLQQVQDDCPKEITDSLTLESVGLKGINRVEFQYSMSESGRETYNLNNFLVLQPLCLKLTQESPIAPSVVACDLSVKHIFTDPDGKQVYSHSIYKKDLKQGRKDDQTAAETAAEAEATEFKNVSLEAARGLGKAVDANALKLQEGMATPVAEQPEEKEEVQFAEAVKASRSKVNPAGVRDNPYAAKPGAGGVQGNPYGN